VRLSEDKRPVAEFHEVIAQNYAMSRKTLSNGTLSLRFMQNAHRAKNLAEVEAERATVKDDGQWEVSQEVKQAWGLLNDVPP
jgi:hypothetical protein